MKRRKTNQRRTIVKPNPKIGVLRPKKTERCLSRQITNEFFSEREYWIN